MFKQYFIQAIAQLKSSPVLTSVSVLGTALTICLIMVVVMMDQVRVASFAPESNRDRMLYVKKMSSKLKKNTKNESSNGPMSIKTAMACFKPLKTAEEVSIYSRMETMQVAIPKGERTGLDIMQSDATFFRIFDFAFTDGKPYDDAEADAGIPLAVITESVARYFFNTTKVTGQDILINDAPYRVCGVVRDVNPLAITAYAQIWIPYMSTDVTKVTWMDETMGMMSVVILAKSSNDFPAIRQECDHLRAVYNGGLGEMEVFYRGQPDDQWTMVNHPYANVEPDISVANRQRLIIFLILLIIPAVNLSSMTQSRLRQRISEIGVRRSFGATRLEIIGQIFAENLILTVMSGMVGLIVCFLITWGWGSSLFDDGGMTYLNVAPQIEAGMLFRFSVFGYALFFCLILNVLSSGYPAWKASRTNIINAMSGK